MATSLILMLAFGFFAVMAAIAVIIEQIKKRNTLTGNQIALDAYSADEQLKAVFASTHKDGKYKKYSIDKRVLVKLFMKLLGEKFRDKMTIHQESCSIELDKEEGINKRSCTFIIGIQTPFGQILMHFSYSPWDFLHFRSKMPRWNLTNPDYSITDFISDNKEVEGISDITLFYPSGLSDNSPEITNILSIIKDCNIEFIEEPDSDEMSHVTHYILTKSHGELMILPKNRQIVPISSKLLDLSYSKMDFEYAGKSYQIPMSKGTRVISDVFIRNGESVSIFGKPGIGKTMLADEISRQVASNPRVSIVYMPPQIFKDLNNLETIGQLQAAVASFQQSGQRIVFFIDEAEQLLRATNDGIHSLETSTMLSILDGTMQKLLQCTFVLTFNADINSLSKAAFRAGRMGLIVHLKDLETDQVDALIDELKVVNAGMIFDQKKWDKVKTGFGTPTLGEIYSCFYAKPKHRKIEAILEELGLEGMEKPVALPKLNVPPAAPRSQQLVEDSPTPPAKVPLSVPKASTAIILDEIPAPSSNKHHGHGKGKHRNRNRR